MMVNRTRAASAALLVLVLWGSAAHCAEGPYEGRPLEALRRRIVTEIMPRVAELRGLDYSTSVPVEVVTQDDVAQYIRETIDEEMTPEELRAFEKIFAYMGLMKPGTDLKQLLITAYSQQIAGYYDDEAKSFSLVKGSPSEGLDAVTIAHELVHALQDQHFDLAAMKVYAEDNDDASLAMSALAEGDASDIMLRYATKSYARGEGPATDYTSFMSLSLGPESVPGLPVILAQDMVFPYTYGTRFVAALHKRAGPDGIDRAFADPPVSTRQIIDPETYFRRNEPYLIKMPDLAGELGGGWTLASQEPVGQFNLGIYLAAHTGTWEIDKAIRGWKGDSLAGYTADGDSDVFIVYYSTWDTSTQALDFAERYKRLITSRFGDAVRTYDSPAISSWERDGRIYYVKRLGNDVLAVENVPKALAAVVIVRSWEAEKTPFGIAQPVADRGRIQPGEKLPWETGGAPSAKDAQGR